MLTLCLSYSALYFSKGLLLYGGGWWSATRDRYSGVVLGLGLLSVYWALVISLLTRYRVKKPINTTLYLR